VPETTSLALAAKSTTTPSALGASTVIAPGTVTVGGVVSRTVTVKDSDPVTPSALVAVQLTVVAPNGKSVPDAGEQLGTTAPLSGSLAVTVYETVAPPGPVASETTAPGVVMLGGTRIAKFQWLASVVKTTYRRYRGMQLLSLTRPEYNSEACPPQG